MSASIGESGFREQPVKVLREWPFEDSARRAEAKTASERLVDFAASSISSAAPGPKRLKIFLGSSAAAKSQAKAVVKALTRPGVDFVPWWDAFTPGRTLLEELDDLSGRVDAALLLFSPESTATIRGNVVNVPNLNVLFEFGYFAGHLGRAHVGMLRYGDFYLPSDFGGYIHITGSKFFKRSAVVQVGKRTANEFERWIAGCDA